VQQLQPTLTNVYDISLDYSAQIPAILGAMDVVTAALRLPSPSAALALLVAQPSLLYDITPASLAARLEQLGVVLACTPDEARDVALQQPVSSGWPSCS
jgi:hypothetical protein